VKRCPHEDAQFCPLYIESHNARGLGCDDGKLGELMGCAVDRGTIDYDTSVAKLARVDIDLVGQCAWRERQSRLKEQRERNMRHNGVN
jgi:hypothetical protein